MKNGILKTILLASVISLSAFTLPQNWFKAGSKPKSYDMGIDEGKGHDGKNAATIKSLDTKIEGFGTLMQECIPGKYLGKRVRMSGWMKSENVNDWAGLWFRVDQSGSKESLSFDNMHDRAVKGTTEWKKYEIVLDVPNNASMLAYGALMSGTGQIWFDSMNFEIVDNSVPVTGSSGKSAVQDAPSNLDFEK